MGQIYCIRNTLNNKCYVGMTKNSFKTRYPSDRWYSKNHNEFIRTDCQLTNKEDWEISIIHDNPDMTEDELSDLEDVWIDRLNCLHPYGYNISRAGKNKGRNKSNYYSKKVNCSNGLTYNTISLAAKTLKIEPQAIRQHIEGLHKHCKGLTFVLYPNTPEPYTGYVIGVSDKEFKPLYCSNGAIYNNLIEASGDTGIKVARILGAIKRDRADHGLRFSYEGFPKEKTKMEGCG